MRKFTLTYGNFREKSAEIEKYLRRLKLKENEIMGGLLILEEVFMRLRNGSEKFSCNVQARKVFGNVRLLVSAEGEPFDPFEQLDSWNENENEEEYYRTLILASRKRQLAYTRKNSENVVKLGDIQLGASCCGTSGGGRLCGKRFSC